MPPPPPASAERLRLDGVHKRFGAVQALSDARLCLHAGEIHALMGQNGAGKSTLIKVLTGVHPADEGQMVLDGQPIRPATPLAAQRLGIATVYQEVNLCPNLTVGENLLTGRLPRRWGLIHHGEMHRRAAAALATLGLAVDTRQRLGDLPVAWQQMVAIARSVSMEARVLILDEPTSSLDEAETARLFDVMRRLRDRGVALLFVTHFLDQAYTMADRFTVMRNGCTVAERPAAELPRLELVSLMVGRPMQAGDLAHTRQRGPAGAPLLEARGLARRGQLAPVDLTLTRGRVTGLAGLLGSGRTEMARLLAGADRADAGTLRLDGAPLVLRTPRDALLAGIGFCPEERKTDGIVAELSVRENIVLALQARSGIWRHLSRRAQEALAQRYITALNIRTADAETPIGELSGGNQQKAILARWLATEPRLLILDEPTRGIDVAAKQDLMDLVLRLCDEGMAVLFIASELPEVLRLSDRVAVMHERRKVAEFDAATLDEAALMRVIAGVDAGGRGARARKTAAA